MVRSDSSSIREWFLGLDIGTNSIGWAATDLEYNLLKFNGNATWGIYLFEEGKTAKERRVNRTARRRLERKKQRIVLLQNFFAKDIAKVDEQFFIRLKESDLWFDDKTTGDKHLFVGDSLNDKEYNRRYPTIHHLICDLMENNDYHDPRLVYMACSYILSHRGHFLLDISEDNVDKVTDFIGIYNDFMSWFDTAEISKPWDCSPVDFGNVMKKKCSVSVKNKALVDLVFNGQKPNYTISEDSIVSIQHLLMIVSGRKTKLADLFCNDQYNDLEINAISLGSATFDDEIDLLSSSIEDIEYDLLLKTKKIYDWSVLVDILGDEKYISEAKVKTYEQHKKDLANLKYFVKKYIPAEYFNIFRKIGKETNYSSYSYNVKNLGKNEPLPKEFKMCSAEDFCKYVSNKLGLIRDRIDNEDVDVFNDMMRRLELIDFCPKQMTSNNRVIPYQLYYIELKKLLLNASCYLRFLSEKDGEMSNMDKILSLMTFRIPYYVGPLNCHSNYAWIIKKKDEKIYPWNFNEVVDLDSCENEFIRRMTNKCTYIAGEDVLPKNSLLYNKYAVLNEINNIRINGEKITVTDKQGIYESLFMKKRRVTVKDIRNYLISQGAMRAGDELSGLDISIKSSLNSYHDFKEYMLAGDLNERDVEAIILRITLTTDRRRLKVWLKQNYNLDDEVCKRISKLKYSDFGRFSERFLTQIFDLDISTGEIRRSENIIQMLWNSNANLMMLLSSSYGYADNISIINKEYYLANPRSIEEQLEDMYLSNSVKRPILRTLEIVKELKNIMGCDPKKVFIEMARGASDEQKNKRTKSRRDQIIELYNSVDNKEEVKELLSLLEKKTDDELRSEKLFLYFSQLGKCMYSGETINIEDIGNNKLYDVDHIWPQSKIKDDSLDNKVLVKTELNGEKSDTYPIKEDWRKRNYYFWSALKEKNLISEKKFERLTRRTPFSDEELASFINRQLVETRQSTKAIAEVLGDLLETSEIVYVKAGLVSEFRQTYKDAPYYALKCREINDLHHAKDAYLNIVMGNIYNVLFSKNPINFIKEGNTYTLRLSKILEHDVIRKDEVAWRANDDIWFDRIITNIHKNNIRFVRYSACQKGALYDLNPMRKGNGQVPRKAHLSDINKYGGYNKQTITGFYLVKYDDKKTKEISFVAVPLLLIDRLRTMEDIAAFCAAEGYHNPEVLLGGRLIKPNALLELDGYRVHISGKSSGDIWFKCGQQLIVSPEYENYLKKIVKFCDRSSSSKKEIMISEYDGINFDDNLALYDVLMSKINNTNYKLLMPTAAEVINKGRNIFISLSLEKQSVCLKNMISLFTCNNSQGKDLELIGGKKSSGIQKITMKLNRKRFKSIRLIDQSVTGLFEKKSSNLLNL